MTAGPDARLLRRATLAITLQVSVAVAATVLLVSGLVFVLTIRSEHRADEATVRAVTEAAGADPTGTELTGTDRVVLARRSPDGTVRTSPGAPPEVLKIDLWRRSAGRSNAGAGGRHFEVYVVDSADGTRTAGVLDVTAREESAERLLGSLLLAGVLGVAAAAAAGTVLGRRAVQPLTRALALQRRFVADASHELRTPLAILHTRAELIRRRTDGHGSWDDDRLRAEIGRLTADTHALGEVVEDLLLSAELQHRPARGARVDVGALVRELVGSVEPYAAERQVTLRAEVGQQEYAVTGVRSSLRRAIAALVDNALGHVDAGGLVTVAVTGGVTGDGGRVRVSVTDNGEGLEPAEAAQLMHRFARGAAGSARPGRRFGLGLALVREVIDAHRGRLEIDGSPGHGARFTMDLPAAGPPEAVR